MYGFMGVVDGGWEAVGDQGPLERSTMAAGLSLRRGRRLNSTLALRWVRTHRLPSRCLLVYKLRQ